jgi:hypothetical protein
MEPMQCPQKISRLILNHSQTLERIITTSITNWADCRVRKGNAAGNFSILRHIALNLLKQEKTAKVGLKIKRSKAGWNHQYLAKILEGGLNVA